MKLSEKQLVMLSAALVTALVAVALVAFFLYTPALTWEPAPRVGYVAVVRIEGPIGYRTSQLALFGPTVDAEEIIKLLDRAAKDPTARAIVLLVDSPGGSAVASEAIYLKVREVAAKKPVVAYVRGMGTSGAQKAILPAHRIVAANSSIVGSIGVFAGIVTYADLLEKLGVRVYIFKAGELKDIGSPLREPTEEEKRILQGMVDEIFSLFKERVLRHRNLTDAALVFSSRPFMAREGLRLGLIDAIGTYEDALRTARKLAGLPEDAPVRELRPPRPGILELLLGSVERALQRPSLVPSVEILAIWPPPQ